MVDSEVPYEEEVVGHVVDEASVREFIFMLNPGAETKVKFGEYVVTRNVVGEEVLGMVRRVSSQNWEVLLGKNTNLNPLDIEHALRCKDYVSFQEIYVAKVKILGKIIRDESEYHIVPNREIIRPLEDVFLASNDLLSILFEKQGKLRINSPEEGGMLPIGYLLSRYDRIRDEGSVKVSLDLQNLLSRHFAILAVTGAGKSNTVALLTTEIVKKFNGTVLIIDTHGEYSSLERDEDYKELVNVLPLAIDLLEFDDTYFASLLRIPENYHKVRACLKIALDRVKSELQEDGCDSSKELLKRLKKTLEAMSSNQETKEALTALTKLQLTWNSLYSVASDAPGADTLSHLQPGKLNILDISSLYTDQMAVILQKLLEKIFEYRVRVKRAKIKGDAEALNKIPQRFLNPILIVLEEAHLFVESGKSEGALSRVKGLISRIAREGRKFGISLGLVSQRPKKIDPDVLSQCNTFIILKLVEREDKRTVQEASEVLSEELVESLDSLDVGEALIVGSAVKIPAAVKIHKFEGKYSGTDVNFLEEWRGLPIKDKESHQNAFSEDNPEIDRGGTREDSPPSGRPFRKQNLWNRGDIPRSSCWAKRGYRKSDRLWSRSNSDLRRSLPF